MTMLIVYSVFPVDAFMKLIQKQLYPTSTEYHEKGFEMNREREIEHLLTALINPTYNRWMFHLVKSIGDIGCPS